MKEIRKKIKSSFFLTLLFSFLLIAGCAGKSEFQSFAETEENIRELAKESSEFVSTVPEENSEQTILSSDETDTAPPEETLSVTEDGEYSTCDEVALYLHLYGHLPANYLTKKEARELGWDNSTGNLWEVAEGMSIGGDRFGNYEGLLPDAADRVWQECDVGYEGGYRGAQRILYSSDGLIYYTEDHYKTFTCLYDGP